jgi:hypothetical protein
MQEDMADMTGDCKEYNEIFIKTFVNEEDRFNLYNNYALEKDLACGEATLSGMKPTRR